MLSRRNIRVKVMQTLYGLDNSDNGTILRKAQAVLSNKIEKSRDLFTYLLFFTTEVARYTEINARQKASKYLPTQEDLTLNTKLAGNELLWKIVDSDPFKKAVQDGKMDIIIDRDLVKKIFQQLIASEEYAEYIDEGSRNKKDEKAILEFIFNSLMLPNEDFINHIEELFINWDDDAEMMQLLVQNYLAKPNAYAHKEILAGEKKEFASDLLETVIKKDEFTRTLIDPKLNNWDAERIASLDLILLKMGVCEFLFFDTIPTKVTINEYIDLAKQYSTPQSGHFVNGLLDNIHKELQAQNKIEKTKYKNSTI